MSHKMQLSHIQYLCKLIHAQSLMYSHAETLMPFSAPAVQEILRILILKIDAHLKHDNSSNL